MQIDELPMSYSKDW